MNKNIVLVLITMIMLMGCSSTEVKKMSDQEKEEKYLIIRGLNLTENEKYDEALENFYKANKMNPKNADTLRYIGIIFSKKNDYVSGRKYFEDALAVNKTDMEALYNISILDFKEEKYDEALKTLNKIPPEKVVDKVIKAKAYIYLKKEEYKKSYDEFQLIKDFTAQDIVFFNNYVNLLDKLKMKDKIYPFIFGMYYRNKFDIQYVLYYANYLKQIGAYDQSISALKEYGINYEFAYEIILSMADNYFLQGNYDEAQKYISIIGQEKMFQYEVLELKEKIFRAKGETSEADKTRNILEKLKNGN